MGATPVPREAGIMNKPTPANEAESIPVPLEDRLLDATVPRGAADVPDGDSAALRKEGRRRSFYGDAWRHLPRDLGYLALTAILLGTVYLALPSALLGVLDPLWSSVLNPFAIVMFFAALFIARWLGALEKVRIGWAEPRPIRPVDWTPRWQQNGATRILSAVASPHYWLHLLHAIVVYPLAASITIGAGALLATGFFGPIVAGILVLDYGWRIDLYLLDNGYDPARTWTLTVILGAASMIVAVVLLPLWARGATLAHYWIDHALLGGFKSDVLERRVVGLQESRAGAVTAEGQALRQIERDLHDGPQQRLVRLRMDLAAAERALDQDPERARTLIAEASEHAHDTLEELRALSRGFAPPILLDRGLVAALEALVSRSTVPVALGVQLPEGLVLPTEVERNVYFTVSELLTNVAKHSGATRAEVSLALVRDYYDRRVLTARVTDDGHGGASVREGHGLEGLLGRMRALDGDVDIASPRGGPTRITARVPLVAVQGVAPDWSDATGARQADSTGSGTSGSGAVAPTPGA
jgi:signal transduction histidine kinase